MQSKSRNLVIQEGIGYPGITDFIAEELGFERLRFSSAPSHPSKGKMFWRLVLNTFGLLWFLRSGRNFGDVIVFGHTGVVIRLLGRLRILNYSRLFCFAFFIHSPRWLAIQRVFLFDSCRDHYVLFSEVEVSRYSEYFQIDRQRLHFLRYGEWNKEAKPAASVRPEFAPPDGYYFSGGYSNRDYISLIKVFRNIPENLIIICSAHNKDISGVPVPSNVTILRDLPGDLFDAYIQYAKAVIIPLKYDTGASGQSVMLRTMRNKKLTIASNLGAIRDYIDNGVTGFLVEDLARDLPPIISRLNMETGLASTMGTAAHELYLRKFSLEAGFLSLREILSN